MMSPLKSQVSSPTTPQSAQLLAHSQAIMLPLSFSHITINLTITKASHHAPGLPAPEIPVILTKAHHSSAQAKLIGTNPNVIAGLNSEGIFLLPFTISAALATIFTIFSPPWLHFPAPEPPPWLHFPANFPHHPAYIMKQLQTFALLRIFNWLITVGSSPKAPPHALVHPTTQLPPSNGQRKRWLSTFLFSSSPTHLGCHYQRG
jgi:hypothetical protein